MKVTIFTDFLLTYQPIHIFIPRYDDNIYGFGIYFEDSGIGIKFIWKTEFGDFRGKLYFANHSGRQSCHWSRVWAEIATDWASKIMCLWSADTLALALIFVLPSYNSFSKLQISRTHLNKLVRHHKRSFPTQAGRTICTWWCGECFLGFEILDSRMILLKRTFDTLKSKVNRCSTV